MARWLLCECVTNLVDGDDARVSRRHTNYRDNSLTSFASSKDSCSKAGAVQISLDISVTQKGKDSQDFPLPCKVVRFE